MITGSQCRAARAFLDWSQDALAERAQIARHTVRLFEQGGKTYGATVQRIEKAFVAGGVEFFETDAGRGVLLRNV